MAIMRVLTLYSRAIKTLGVKQDSLNCVVSGKINILKAALTELFVHSGVAERIYMSLIKVR